MKDKKQYSKKQHYVQKALIEEWSENHLVNIARKNEDGSIVEEKPKAPGAVFYENYYYEHVYDFESAELHRTNGFKTCTDENHTFQTNDGEQYCKRIEDHGFPVIQKILSSVLDNSNVVIITKDEKVRLCRYLTLQALRTPGGRKNYQYNYEKCFISAESKNEDAINSFVSNFAYLQMIGAYDDRGFADNIEMPKSVFLHIFELIVDMALYILTLPICATEQFILGDNPCVILGEKENIWGLLMPVSPKALILLLSNNVHISGECDILPCPEEWRLFELSSQISTAETKLILCDRYDGISIILQAIKAKPDLHNNLQKIWRAKDLVNEERS